MLPADVLRQVRRLHLRARRLVQTLLGGEYHSAFKGAGLSFEEVREYQPGDDVRTIDWNVTARVGHPFIKRFVEERRLTLLLVVDVSASQKFGSGLLTKRAAAAELAALLALCRSQQQRPRRPDWVHRYHRAVRSSQQRASPRSSLAPRCPRLRTDANRNRSGNRARLHHESATPPCDCVRD